MQKKWQYRHWSVCSLRAQTALKSSLIRAYTVCLDLSVPVLRSFKIILMAKSVVWSYREGDRGEVQSRLGLTGRGTGGRYNLGLILQGGGQGQGIVSALSYRKGNRGEVQSPFLNFISVQAHSFCHVFSLLGSTVVYHFKYRTGAEGSI